ncbi:HAD family hydrolase [Streptomyces endophytica]|uniref:HAD family hydrolase n=1 Tax=Streptomyces endophytica TaxID=2991496 RepID=A0ABY6PG59_9ACTN|nr:HAD family hydrolase [Streptomyces endophytica]UZJ32858.1 HAD family hydrolase [Streptomyces endophytica]
MTSLRPGERTAPAPKVLVTDLDGTLLGGDRADRGRLRAALERHPEVTVVFATGRSLTSVERILDRDPLVPRPRWIIADVGASVIDGSDRSRVDVVQNQLREGWPGHRRVRERMARFPELEYQEGWSRRAAARSSCAPGGSPTTSPPR